MQLPPDLAETLARIEALHPTLKATAPAVTSPPSGQEYHAARAEAIREWVRAMPPAAEREYADLASDEHNREALDTCDAYLSNLEAARDVGLGVVLTGPVGTGKTTAAWALARAIVEAEETGRDAGPDGCIWRTMGRGGPAPVNSVQVHTWCDLVEAEREDWRRETRRGPLRAANAARWLVLDDLGAPGTLDEVSQGLLFRIVDWRYKERRPLIVTSNLALDPGRPGPMDVRIVDRITDPSRFLVRVLGGPSRRQKRNET